jgi:soluble lytic murein transglycosylase
MNEALRNGDARRLSGDRQPRPAAGLQLRRGESFAGWLALNKLRNPSLARQHFQRLDSYVKSPVSKSRAAYWLGRVSEAEGDQAAARAHYQRGALYSTTFYGNWPPSARASATCS